jgi:hypothetical protein
VVVLAANIEVLEEGTVRTRRMLRTGPRSGRRQELVHQGTDGTIDVRCGQLRGPVVISVWSVRSTAAATMGRSVESASRTTIFSRGSWRSHARWRSRRPTKPTEPQSFTGERMLTMSGPFARARAMMALMSAIYLRRLCIVCNYRRSSTQRARTSRADTAAANRRHRAITSQWIGANHREPNGGGM